MTTIATIETRYPVTVALDFAFKAQLINSEAEKKLRDELQDLVAESAKKFVGFQSTKSFRKALEITLGTISLAVVHSTKGVKDRERWAKHILDKGLTTLAREAVSMIKTLTKASASPQFDPKDISTQGSPRDFLLWLVQARNVKRNNEWCGYMSYKASILNRENARRTEQLTRWLITELTGFPSDNWIAYVISISNDSERIPMVDEVLNTLLFRHCVDLSIPRNPILERKDFDAVRTRYQADPVKWVKEAKGRYERLREKIPEELRPGLIWVQDWFKTHLSKGPPRAPKKWNDMTSIPGITGVFLYSFFA